MRLIEHRPLAGRIGIVLLVWIAFTLSAPGFAAADEHDSYRLMIRYGSLPAADAHEAQPSAAFLRKARRIDIDVDVAAVDQGRISTRDAVLSYHIDASHDGDITLGIALTYARAGGQSSVDTHVALRRNRWLRLGFERNGDGKGNAVYVRLRSSQFQL